MCCFTCDPHHGDCRAPVRPAASGAGRTLDRRPGVIGRRNVCSAAGLHGCRRHCLCILVVAVLAFTIPLPLTDKANPSDTSFVPVPEWYFLFYYELLSTYMDRGTGGDLGAAALCDPGHVVLAVYRSQPRAKSLFGGPSRLAAVCCFSSSCSGLLGISIKNLYAVPRTDPPWPEGRRCMRNWAVPVATGSMEKARRGAGSVDHWGHEAGSYPAPQAFS